MNRKFTLILLLVLPLLMFSCGGNKFVKNPLDDMIKENLEADAFSFILYDMEVKGTFAKQYFHQYKTVITKGDDTKENTTGWIEVSKDYFNKNVDNMGMELASKLDGKVNKTAGPPGYNSYIGNEKYGSWQTSGGNSFWVFYGQYAFMNSMFNLMTYPVRRSYYDDYYRSYRGVRPYYGTGGGGGSTRMYGTQSAYNKSNNKSSRWRASGSSRTYRNGNRYSSRSFSSRSGGGYGK